MSLHESAFLKACRREPVPHTPVWFMRQAGRALPEYRALREGTGMLEACFRPDLVTEITLQPVRRFGVDAAILFSDIVVPLKALGLDLDIVAGVGPVIAEPIRAAADLDRLVPLEGAPEIGEAVKLLVRRARQHPADRLRWCPVHPRLVPRRGRPLQGPAPDQGPHVRRPTAVARADVAVGGHHAGLPAGAAGRRRLRRTAVRLVGGSTACRGLPRVRACRTARGSWPVWPSRTRACRGSTSASGPGSCCTTWARPGPMSSAWTSGCRWTRRHSGSARARRCRATSTRRCCSPRRRRCGR